MMDSVSKQRWSQEDYMRPASLIDCLSDAARDSPSERERQILSNMIIEYLSYWLETPDLTSTGFYSAMEGLGRALCKARVQTILFSAIEPLLTTELQELQIAWTVNVFEPLLRSPWAAEEDEDKALFCWLMKLRANPKTAWIIEEAYKSYGEERLLQDMQIFGMT